MARAMKDSGIQWIEQIPEGWEVKRLKALFTFGKGLPITKENLVEIGIPVISYGQIHSKTNSGVRLQDDLVRYVPDTYLKSNPDSLVHKGDYIFADTSEDLEGCGNCVFADKEKMLFAGYHTIIFKNKGTSNNNYLAYLFKTDSWRNQIRSKCFGVKLFSITRKILASANIILPPLEEQNCIAAFLDDKCTAIDNVLEKTKASIEEYKKLKQSVVTQAVTKGIRGNRPMKDSGVQWIGQIPEEWTLSKLKYNVIQKSDRADSNQVYIGLENIESGTGKYIDIAENNFEAEGSSIAVKIGDILFGKLRPYLAKCYIAEFDAACSTEFIVMEAIDINITFLQYLMLSPIFIDEVNMSTYGTKMPRASWTFIGNMYIPAPNGFEQQEIASYLDTKCAEIDTLISKKEQFLKEIEAYKKSLIYEYVTGKKEVA